MSHNTAMARLRNMLLKPSTDKLKLQAARFALNYLDEHGVGLSSHTVITMAKRVMGRKNAKN